MYLFVGDPEKNLPRSSPYHPHCTPLPEINIWWIHHNLFLQLYILLLYLFLMLNVCAANLNWVKDSRGVKYGKYIFSHLTSEISLSCFIFYTSFYYMITASEWGKQTPRITIYQCIMSLLKDINWNIIFINFSTKKYLEWYHWYRYKLDTKTPPRNKSNGFNVL